MKKVQTHYKSLLPGTLLPLLFACSTMDVRTAADPQADLSKYKTYSWAPSTAEAQGRPPSILDQTVKTSVDRELAKKGLKPAGGSSPDLLVTYFGASGEVLRNSPAPAYGYPYYPSYGTTYVTREGSLTLQLIDPKTKRIVWQGTATDTVSDAGASQEQVSSAVNEVLEKYPSA